MANPRGNKREQQWATGDTLISWGEQMCTPHLPSLWRRLPSSASRPSTHMGSELSSLTVTNCSKVSRGKETWKLGKGGERKCWRMTQKGIRGLSRLRVEAWAPVAAWLASEREIAPLMYSTVFECTRCLLASSSFEGQRSPWWVSGLTLSTAMEFCPQGVSSTFI